MLFASEEDQKEKPDLSYVKPDSKRALEGERTLPFENVLIDDVHLGRGVEHSESAERKLNLKVTTELGGDVIYIDGLLSLEECKELCSLVDNSDELTFWSEAGRDNEKARSFRDADTLEVKSPTFADMLWNRIDEHLNNEKRYIHIENEQEGTDKENPQWERELPGDWIPCTFNHDLLFARYPCEGAFAPHTDGRAIHNFNRRSFESVIIFLNDIF